MAGVKVLVRPLQHLVAFRTVRPGEDFLEFREAVDATAVLRRAGAFTSDARRVSLAVPGDRAGLDEKLVLRADLAGQLGLVRGGFEIVHTAALSNAVIGSPRPQVKHVGTGLF